MRITFLLPGRSLKPAGGYKVVYEHANRLVQRGHQVSVVHPWGCAPPKSPYASFRAWLWVFWVRIRRGTIAPWFELDDRVRLRVVLYPAASSLPASDALVATAWHTASWVDAAVPEKGAGLYFIQGYETWDGDVDKVRATWRLPLQKVVISRWLEEIAAELGEGERTTRVPIGMDLDRLGVDIPLAEREQRIGALYNSGKEKRSEDIVATMVAAKSRYPALTAVFFGTAPRPASIPAWIEYTMLPDADQLRALYNSCSIFLQASRSEGWGLPACEAMLCGCALVTVANGGSREYALDRETALVVEPGQVGDFADRACELLGDADLRQRLAARGTAQLQGYTWDSSAAQFEAVIEGAVAAGGGAR
jgi:L-malate glycosyltransferase